MKRPQTLTGRGFQQKTFMMSNRNQDILFQLIRSLEKAEKRHFKLYIKRSSGKEELKIVKLFDILDKQKEYDEKALMKKMDEATKPQLANLKAHLYKQILASLRLLKASDSLDLQLNEQFDHAHILYKKGLFIQSLRIIERAKELARTNQKFNSLLQLITLEKRIENLHITRSMNVKARMLESESNDVTSHIDMVNRLSTLALKLYGWYVEQGHARNEEDEKDIRRFMKESLPENVWEQTGFYQRLYLYQCYTWYAFIRQDFIQYYRYTCKWLDLFHEQPLMIRVETGHYIKALHNVLNAHFDLRNHRKFEGALADLEKFSLTERVKENDNFRVQSFIYISIARINQHFMRGTFTEGLPLVPVIEKELSDSEIFLDRHRVLVLNYKFAMLYFGSGDYNTSIDYLQKVINDNSNLRYDLQCYARLLHLMAHYELGNDMLMESLAKSVYRFMAKMQNLTMVEEAIFKFLRQSLPLSPRQLRPEFEKLLHTIKHLEKNRFQTRSFAYLDIISWIEGKVYGKTMEAVVREKYLGSRRR
jgi:tetratricopeptide (TPR) repeat protein